MATTDEMLEQIDDDLDEIERRQQEVDEIEELLTCTGCGCTDLRACDGGCSWASYSPPLCTRCAA